MDISRTLPADVGRELLEDVLAAKALVESYARVSAEALIELDADRRISRFNDSAERLLGYPALHVMHTDFAELLDPSNRIDVFGVPPLPAEIGSTVLILRDSRGVPVPVQSRYLAIMRDGQIDGWVLAFHARKRVEEIEQLKRELVSTVSHELKTPLAAIKAYTATLRVNPALQETRREEFLEVVEQQADRLSRLIDDMLLVARVDAAQLLRKRVMVSLDTLVDDAIAETKFDPRKYLVVRRYPGVQISGDPDRLRDVLRNLIENAVKYMPAGGTIEISAQEHGDSAVVEIRDHGVGIAEEHLPYIFDRFYRVEDPKTPDAGGSGLGLYIVQALVRAHGGTIDVRSTPGAGTTFRLIFPVRR